MLKFECQVSVLLKAVQAALPAITGKSTMQILRHVLIEASEDGKLLLTGTDLEMGVRAFTQATVTNPGAIAAEAKMLSALLGKLPQSAQVVLQQRDNFGLTAQCLKSNYILNGLDAKDFPPWIGQGDIEERCCFDIAGTNLLNIINQTAYCISDDKARPLLTGSFLKVLDGELTMVCTDTHRLAVKTHSLTRSDKSMQVILPPGFISSLKAFCAKEAVVSIEFSPRCCWVTLPEANIEIYSKVLEGQYPNYGRVIPATHDITLTFNREELENAIERVMLVAEEDANRVVLDATGMFAELTGKSTSGQIAREEVAVTVDGAVKEPIAWNGKYWLSALATCKGENVQMELNESPLKPGVMFDMAGEERDASLTIVLMPMQVI